MCNKTFIHHSLNSRLLIGKTISLLIVIILSALLAQRTSAQPTIISFAPASGPVGTEVTITGTNFSSTPANNIVYFGAVKSPVTSATTTTLKVNVPVGTTYQPITVTTNGLTAYSDKPFLVKFESEAGPFTASSFSTNIDFVTDIFPTDNQLSDLDGDGKPDIIVSDYYGSNLTVLNNQSTKGNIAFGSIVNLNTSGDAQGCFVGDFDGDGKQDIGAANNNTNSISIFRNQSCVGNISFGSKTDFATSAGPRNSSIGDLDGDGKADIAIANTNAASISILKNMSTTGNISFATKIDAEIGTGSVPFVCAIGDLDADGKADIVVGNRGVGYISIFRNISTPGKILLAPRMDINVSKEKAPNGISIGDLDGDGKPDVVVANFGDDFNPAWVSILRNTSTVGTISFEKNIDFFTGGAGCHSAAITDLDGDGKPDLVTDNYWDGTLSLFKNTSTSGHISFDKPVLLAAGSGPNHPKISDLDGDKKPDIEVPNIFSQSVSAFRNLIKPSLQVDAGGDTTVHLTQSQGTNCVTLTAHASRGTAPYKYSWSPGKDSTASISVCPTKTTTYTVTVTDAKGNTDSDQVKVSVVDLRPQLSIQDVTVLESQGLAAVRVRISKPTKKRILVSYTTQDKTAVNPDDYIALSAPLLFIPGFNTTAIAIIPIVNDNIQENTEQFLIRLIDPLNAGIKDGVGVVTIIDDDGLTTKAAERPGRVKEQSTSLHIQVYPNPSENAFTLQLEGGANKSPINVQVYDVAGRLIEVRNHISTGQRIRIGSSYKAGTYILVAEQGQQYIQTKVIKSGN
jgi:hypothetical protein